MIKQEIKETKEDNTTDMDEQIIVEIVNLKDFPKPLTDSSVTGIMMTDTPDSSTNKEVTNINVSNNNKIDSNRQDFLSLINKAINKEFSTTEVTLTDNMNCIQERLISSKYYGKSSKRLIQTNGEELINDKGICTEVIKDRSSKVDLRNSFMDLTNVPFNFILLLIPKEIDFFNNVTILNDTKERIYRTKRSLSSLKTEISLDDQLTENGKKIFRKNKETEICSYSLIAFHHQHIIQTPCEKEFIGKETKDETMLTISFSQDKWTDSLIGVPSKIIINNRLTPLAVISNIHIIDILVDVLVKEVLADSPLPIIKENINCGNFLNKDRFNFLTDRTNHKFLTDLPIIIMDERLYREALFHTFL